MARGKQPTKPKEMFKPYDPADVPDIMPFPEVALVFATKSEDTAVPRLNEHQQSWILDIGLRNVDLPSLKGKAATAFYDQLKTDAFEAKAFKHNPQPQDAAEEARLPALAAAWKREHPKKNKNVTPAADADDGNTSDDEEDEGARRALLRAGWRSAMQKVISNKRSAEITKRKGKSKNDDAEDCLALPPTGRDKFREDRHDEIHEYSKTLPGAINAGGKFRKAESLMWAEEDQASWEAAASSEEDVDWVARQKLVARGFKNMVNTLHTSGKFRPFVATMLMGWLGEDGKVSEAVPDGIRVREPFEKKYGKLVGEQIDNMYEWAEQPLRDYVATREDSVKGAAPLFPLSAEALDDMSPKALAQAVTSFMEESYQAVFGSQEIPWAAIASAPDEYYDTTRFPLTFAATGLVKLTLPEWYEVATTLVSKAGARTSGFFRKARGGEDGRPVEGTPPREEEAAGVDREEEAGAARREEAGAARREEVAAARREEEAAAAHREEEAAAHREEAVAARWEEEAAACREEEAAVAHREEAAAYREEAAARREEEVAAARREEEAAAYREAEAAAARQEEKEAACREEEEAARREEAAAAHLEEAAARREKEAAARREKEATKKGGRQRKSPQSNSDPQEAAKEREQQAAAKASAPRAKPRLSYEYVEASPLKPKGKKSARIELKTERTSVISKDFSSNIYIFTLMGDLKFWTSYVVRELEIKVRTQEVGQT
ncbi:hypothetical protein DFH08DRAFT_815768 [Mycena albidolilacea]|uniref:Uncharacterized protein n=1 Tax=Mycena albidolilacea TaxID=1033008 RepID=A0AAD6ZM79_9AGAR|nr:hypothetical protein DFH08DRAFT_815768 [Mycena albidolilacea]